MVSQKVNSSQTVLLNGVGSSTSTDSIIAHFPATKGIASYPKNLFCPVCDQISRRCTYQKDGISQPIFHCHTNREVQKWQSINGFICLKPATGHTATFALKTSIDSLSSEIVRQPEKWQAMDLIDKSMPIDERDYWYRQELASMPLYDSHKEYLLNRGFTEEQINSFMFRSTGRSPRVKSEAPASLPGTRNGIFAIGLDRDGIIIPSLTFEGKISHLKIADLHPGDKGSKYRPVSCKDSPIHICGEMPVEIYFPSGEHKRIYIIEGGGFKSLLAHLRLNIPVVAFTGGNDSSSPRQLEKVIREARKLYGEDVEFIKIPDGGDCFNREVRARIKKNCEFWSDKGVKVSLLWWEQTEKKVTPDIDELTKDRFLEASVINLDQFLKIGEATINADFNHALLVELSQAALFTPDIKITLKDGEYLNQIDLMNRYPGVSLALKGDAGIGKTTAGMNYFKATGEIFVWVCPTNSLVFNILGVAQQTSVKALNAKENKDMIADSGTSLITCFEQSYQLSGRTDKKVLVIDEAEAQLATLAQGGTVSGSELPRHRVRVKTCLSESSLVILYDACLTDFTVKAYEQLSEKKLLKVEIVREKPKKKKLTFVSTIKTMKDGSEKIIPGDISNILDRVSKFERVLIASDSRVNAEALHRRLEAIGQKGHCIHRGNSHEDKNKSYLLNMQKAIEENQWDYLIYSPTMAQGVSIDFKYFDAVFALFVGTIGTQNQYQMIHRCRDTEIPYFIYCVERSRVSKEERVNLINFEARQEFKKERILTQSEYRIGESWKERAIKALDRIDPFWEELADCYEEQRRKENSVLRDNLLAHSLRHNCTVSFEMEEKENVEAAKIHKEVRELILLEDDLRLFNASIEPLKEARIKHKNNPTPETEAIVKKAQLISDFPDIDNQSFWSLELITGLRKEREFTQTIKKAWLFDNFAEFQEWETAKTIQVFEDQEHPETSLKSLKSYFEIDKIAYLKKLEISRLTESEFKSDNPIIAEILDKLRKNRSMSLTLLNKEYLSKNLIPKEVIAIIKKLVGIIGYRLVDLGRSVCEDGVTRTKYELSRVQLKEIDEDTFKTFYEAFGEKVKSDLTGLQAGIPLQDDEQERTHSSPIFDSSQPVVVVGDSPRQEDEINRDKVLSLLDSPEELNSYLYDFGIPDYLEFKAVCAFSAEQLEKLEAAKSYERSMINSF